MRQRKTSIVLVGLWLGALTAVAEDDSFRFDYEIAPILAREGCAAADCHGGATGRANFKLSLFATDSRADYRAIVQDLDGRRVDFQDAEQSLLLLKPSRQLKHGGGKVFTDNSPNLQRLKEWIREGAPWSHGQPYELESVEPIFQEDRVTHVWATFRNQSSKRDVLELARFISTHPAVASVSNDGEITRHRPGDTWIIASYAGLSGRIRLRVPFGDMTLASTTHPLDAEWSRELSELGLRAAAPAEPRTLVRRLYLDLTGRVPSPEEVAAFLALSAKERVGTTARELLKQDAFAEAFLPILRGWLDVPFGGADDTGPRRETYRRLNGLLVDWVRSGDSLKVLAEQMVTSDTPFLKRFEDPRDRAEYLGKTLLGMSIGCARCHNHPLDRWRQDQHLRFSAWFAEPRPNPDQPETMMAGKFFLPGDQKAIRPALLPMGKGSVPVTESREEALSWLIFDGSAGQFSRNVSNRIFGWLVGRHLVDPPDDHRETNPAVFEGMLALLGKHLEVSSYDLRDLVQFIVTSQSYQMRSEPEIDEELEGSPLIHYLARREARPLTEGQYQRSLEFLLDVPIDAWTLPDAPLARQLALLNRGQLQRSLATPGNQIEAIFDFEPSPDRQLEGLFQRILSRSPTAEEQETFLPVLTETDDVHEAGKDLAFALLTSREFGSQR